MLPIVSRNLCGPAPASDRGLSFRFGRSWQRATDLMVAATLLVLTLPLLILAALALRLEGAGPFFCSRPYVGQGACEFRLWSLRTSPVNSGENGSKRRAIAGYASRLTRIDQIPVLFSVVRGDMTLKGPCPIPLDAEGLTIPQGSERHWAPAATPGLSGWIHRTETDGID
ncbi:sugar transferase [Muricoccus aerilatus]|uniref:sugar transferase n=1 Tax=Muricoccus aerilatus TaxID=452982 RepID=UPI000A078ED4